MSIPFNFYLCNLDLGLWGNFVHTLPGNIPPDTVCTDDKKKGKHPNVFIKRELPLFNLLIFCYLKLAIYNEPNKNLNMKEDIYGFISTVSETQMCLCLTEEVD